MLSFRRALVAAAFLLTILFLLSRSHESEASLAATKPSTANGADSSQKKPVASSQADTTVSQPDNEPPSSQKPMIDLATLPLREQLAYQYPYNLKSKFPAYIWQTWKRTPQDTNFEFRDHEASWTDQHPGFIHEVITDDVALALLSLLYASVPDVLDAYKSLPLPVLRADFFRYLILYARGGIYSDIDTFALRSAIEWVPTTIPRKSVGLVIGIEADPDREDWAQWYSRRIQFCQWTIQAKPGHPALREVISRITEETLKRKRDGTLLKTVDKNVIEFTGPAVWTDVLFDYFNDKKFFDIKATGAVVDWRNFTGMEVPKKVGDVVVLPITGFSPGVRQMGAKDYEDPQAMVRHDFEGTWKPEHERHIGEIFED